MIHGNKGDPGNAGRMGAIEERTLVKAETVLEILIKMHLGDQTCTLVFRLEIEMYK